MKIDFIITEFHRPELLDKTLAALDWKCAHMVTIHHDDQDDEVYETEARLDIYSYPRVGQVVAIDKLMACVRTEYYCHLEEDWLQVDDLKEGIAEAIKILEENPMCGSVSLRGPGTREHNGHPHEEVDGVLRMKSGWNGWSGYSHAPSVRRLSDYLVVAGTYGSMVEFNRKFPWEAERQIGNIYRNRGFWFATTRKPYFKHIGEGQSTFGK